MWETQWLLGYDCLTNKALLPPPQEYTVQVLRLFYLIHMMFVNKFRSPRYKLLLPRYTSTVFDGDYYVNCDVANIPIFVKPNMANLKRTFAIKSC